MKNFIKKIFTKNEVSLISSTSSKWRELRQSNIKEWENKLKHAKNGKRILIATSMGCYEHATIMESLLSVALFMRGANVEVLLCDNALPCCQMTKVSNVTPNKLLKRKDTPRCETCYKLGHDIFKEIGIKINQYNDYIDKSMRTAAENLAGSVSLSNVDSFTYKDLAVGEHALAGALRYYARGDLNGIKDADLIVKRYLNASLLTVFALESLLKKKKYDVAVFHHGIYVPQGIIGEVCRRNKIRVVNWNPSYRKQTFIFSHNDSYHHTMITEPVETWKGNEWSAEIEKLTMNYLKSRWYGTDDWIWFHEKPIEGEDEIEKELNIDFRKPCIGLLSSVMWDAQLHYKSNAFNNMLDWICQTIDYFKKRNDLNLIIRVHPAEIRGLVPSNQKLVDEINKRFNQIPQNIYIIPPESHLSTYAVMEKCNAVIIYNTKTGIEISSMGIPVIVAGEAWIRNKGFSIDASTPEDYFDILYMLPYSERLDEERHLSAKKYAYHFFFKRMIEIPFIVSHKKHKFCLELSDFRDLGEGNCKGLDVICEGILNEKPFISKA